MTASAFEQLPLVRSGVRALGETSFDRTGGNEDWVSGATNTLYVDDKGDRVLLDALGPGCVNRMWFTFIDPKEVIHVYFDGEPTARINLPLVSLFEGKTPPFVSPFVGNAEVSSGGFFSYLPLPFSQSIKVTTSNVHNFYYHIQYHTFDPQTKVSSWMGGEDTSEAAALLLHAGADPKPDHGDDSAASGVVAILPGDQATLLDVSGPRTLTSLHLVVPGIAPMKEGAVTDAGRAFTGASEFDVTIDAKNEGVVLVRRLDFGIAHQKAEVFVDGAPAGTWFDEGASGTFRNHPFALPPSLTKGKSKVHVRVAFASSAEDWNEFHYWAYSRLHGRDVLTDELEIGDDASESAHAYAVTGATFAGTRTLDYPKAATMADALNDLWVRITWDDAALPSVEAPIGAFFAQGQYGPGLGRGLAAGLAEDGAFYIYFPMPFAKRAQVALVNKGSGTREGLWYEVRHRPFAGSFDDIGTFATAFHEATPSAPGHDLSLLDVQGSGTIVGIVQSETGPTIRGYLEGDDRLLIDGRRTPSIHGTGTEDLYNGGFYFNRGTYGAPLAGNPTHAQTPSEDGTAMYRFFFPDVIPFRSGARFTIEHGPADDVEVNAWTLTYYYTQARTRLVATDELVIGDASSETAHDYAVQGETFRGTRTYSFEGENGALFTASGRAHTGSSSFTLHVDPKNSGIILRRLSDQHIGRQRARVFVDGAAIGEFYAPQSNQDHAWREDELVLPLAATAGKSQLAIRIEFISSSKDWNEFGYRALSLLE